MAIGVTLLDEVEVVGQLDVGAVLGDDARWANQHDVVSLLVCELDVVAIRANDARVANHATLGHQLSHGEGSRCCGNVKGGLSVGQLAVGARLCDDASGSNQHDVVGEVVGELGVHPVGTDDPRRPNLCADADGEHADSCL